MKRSCWSRGGWLLGLVSAALGDGSRCDSPRLLSPAPPGMRSARSPEVVVDGAGRVHVFWLAFEQDRWRVAHRALDDERVELLSSADEHALALSVAGTGAGNLAVAWQALGEGVTRPRLRCSPDGGTSWQAPVELGPAAWRAFGPQLLPDRNGGLHAAWAASEGERWKVRHRFSPDGGRSWPEPAHAIETRWSPDRDGTFPCLALARDDALLLVSLEGGPERELLVRVSRDRGATWEPAQRPGRPGAREVSVFPPGGGACELLWVDATGAFWFARSETGATWTDPIALPAGSPGDGGRILDLLAGDQGLWALVVAGRGAQGPHLAVLSADHGDARWELSGWLGPVRDPDAVEGALAATPSSIAAVHTGGPGEFPANAPRPSLRPVPGPGRARPTPLSCGGTATRTAPWSPSTRIAGAPGESRPPPRSAPALWQDGPPVTAETVLGLGDARFVFRPRGAQLELASLVLGESSFPLRPGSGGWSLRFAEAGGAGRALVSSASEGGQEQAALTARPAQNAVCMRWNGSTRVGPHPVTYQVLTRWELSRSGLLEARIGVLFEAAEPVFLAEAWFPRLLIGPECGADRLLLPALGGYLVDRPFRPEIDWTPFERPHSRLSIPTLALYGRSCTAGLLYTDDDYDEHWKTHNVARSGSGLELRTRHVPADVFSSREYAAPFAVRIGAFSGDWVDVGEQHRTRLALERPERAKARPAQDRAAQPCYSYSFDPGEGRDDFDQLPVLQARTRQVLGSGAYVRLYSAHRPDRFDAFYDLGYLPGAPSFRAGTRETQSLGAVVAPYLQSSLARDPRPLGRSSSPELLGALVRTESGELLRPPVRGSVVPCSGTRSWREIFVGNAVDVASFSGALGLYLDYFAVTACYARDHEHAPGGGRYPWDSRLDHLALANRGRTTGCAPRTPTGP